jgi:membrane protein required for colicin V production
MTTFDLIAGLIILVSLAVGFVRGATRELVTALSFVLAAALSLLLLRFTGALARPLIDPDWVAVLVALLVVLVILFVALRLLGGRLSHGLLETQALGTVDRTVGVGIGLVRALVVLGAFSLLFSAATPEARRPKWITGAALYPLATASGKMLMAFAPEGKAAAGKIRPAIEKAVREGSGETPADEGYDESELKSVDDLVEKSR